MIYPILWLLPTPRTISSVGSTCKVASCKEAIASHIVCPLKVPRWDEVQELYFEHMVFVLVAAQVVLVCFLIRNLVIVWSDVGV